MVIRDNLPHNLSEVLLIFDAEHTDQVNLQLEKLAEIKINIFDHLDINILIMVDKLGVKVLEQLNIPVDNNNSRVILLR